MRGPWHIAVQQDKNEHDEPYVAYLDLVHLPPIRVAAGRTSEEAAASAQDTWSRVLGHPFGPQDFVIHQEVGDLPLYFDEVNPDAEVPVQERSEDPSAPSAPSGSGGN